MNLAGKIKELAAYLWSPVKGNSPDGTCEEGKLYPQGRCLGDDAFVTTSGTESLIYREGARVLHCQCYIAWDRGPNARYVYSDYWDSWQPPFENEVITEEKRKEIVLRLAKSEEFGGTKIIDLKSMS